VKENNIFSLKKSKIDPNILEDRKKKKNWIKLHDHFVAASHDQYDELMGSKITQQQQKSPFKTVTLSEIDKNGVYINKSKSEIGYSSGKLGSISALSASIFDEISEKHKVKQIIRPISTENEKNQLEITDPSINFKFFTTTSTCIFMADDKNELYFWRFPNLAKDKEDCPKVEKLDDQNSDFKISDFKITPNEKILSFESSNLMLGILLSNGRIIRILDQTLKHFIDKTNLKYLQGNFPGYQTSTGQPTDISKSFKKFYVNKFYTYLLFDSGEIYINGLFIRVWWIRCLLGIWGGKVLNMRWLMLLVLNCWVLKGKA